MNCLLCEQPKQSSPSWQSLIAIEKSTLICEDCSNQFKRVDIIEVGDNIDSFTSIFTYNEAMRDYLHQYKFLQDIALAGAFSNELKQALSKEKAIIVPIPMHPNKKIERTFAQVDELLKAADVPFADLLIKTNHEVMGEKTREERLSMSRLFQIKPQVEIESTTYILVDDIYTTGTTLQHAALTLKEAGAKTVHAVTLIRAASEQ